MDTRELLADRNGPYSFLSAKDAFEQLTIREKLYCHHMSRAGFYGSRILLEQISQEATGIFDLLMELHRSVQGDWKKLQIRTSIDDADLHSFLEYAAMFLANIGNFRSNGYRKFIPRLSLDSFASICSITPLARSKFHEVKHAVYSLRPSMVGFPSADSQSTFYLGETLNEGEVQMVEQILQQANIISLNTRVRKTTDTATAVTTFEVLVASSELLPPRELETGQEQVHAILTYGDFAHYLGNVVDELVLAKSFVANDTQDQMLNALIKSLRSGDMQAFKKHQTLWVMDVDPTIEISHGFIETYQDPHGVRASWQGFVGILDKSVSDTYHILSERAMEFLQTLPWNKIASAGSTPGKSPFENLVFRKPGFVNLTVLSNTMAEIVSGINLPNFDDICHDCGSKNLTLGNTNNDSNLDTRAPFIQAGDLDVYRKCRARAFEVMIACHELLGHGSGRLLVESSPQIFNFDPANAPLDPLTSQPIQTWYKPGETWQSVFVKDCNSYEECRADAVSLLLVCHEPLLEVFGYTGRSKIPSDDIVYVGWLQFIQGALKGLSTWNPTTQKWGHAQKQGQYVLLRCLLDVGPSFLFLEQSADGLSIRLNKSMIATHGVPAVEKLLLTLQVYKSTANVAAGAELWRRYSAMTEDFITVRESTARHKPNRTQWVQANTKIDGETVVLLEYPASKEGLIQSWAERAV